MADKQTGKDTIIGPETRVSGEIRGDEDLIVRGRVDGKIQLSQTLTVEAGGIVQADVDVRCIVVAGVVLGNVTASESVRLTEKAKVVGSLSAPRIIIEAGAAYRGKVEMGPVSVSRASEQRQAERSTPAQRQAPRMAPPPRAAVIAAGASSAPRISASSSNGSVSRVAGSAPRVASAALPRSSSPPGMPRPESVSMGVASSPGWAKKKLRRK